MKILGKLQERVLQLYRMPSQINQLKEAMGRVESRLNQASEPQSLIDREFKVYSQWGEDGIIDFLVRRVNVMNPVFVEFGVENYTEANTLFLLKHRHWRGLVIDGSARNIESIRSGDVFWRYDLQAVEAFIHSDNINQIIKSADIRGDIGLLSIDIDGNDFWVWKAIDVVQPAIVVCEYNSLFGPEAAITIPYEAEFNRTEAHVSNMYYGASIAALTHLAHAKGYSLVGGNSAGNNVFFVRNDALNGLRAVSPAKAYVRSAFREGRTSDGAVELLSFAERQAAIQHMPVINVITGDRHTLRELL